MNWTEMTSVQRDTLIAEKEDKPLIEQDLFLSQVAAVMGSKPASEIVQDMLTYYHIIDFNENKENSL